MNQVNDYLLSIKFLEYNQEIIKLFKTNKYLYKINQNIEQKKVCVTLDEEIEEAKRLLKKQDLNKAYDFIVKNYNGTRS